MMFRVITLFVILQTIAVSWASVTVPYIKPMLLGRTFDYSKSIVGNDIYPPDVRKNALETNHYETKVKYEVVRSAKERRDVLDISGHLSVQVMSGVVDFKGSGEYLKESFDAGNNVEVVAKIAFLTITRSITDDKRPEPGWDKKPNIIGQHYVRSITYGGNLIASLKFKAKNERDKKKLAIKVEAKVSGKKFGVGVGGQFKQLAESVKDISTLTISYKATAPLVTVPVDIDSLVKAIEDFPTSVRSIDGGIGVPIEAELVELTQLSPSPKLKFLVDTVIQTRIASLETFYFDLRITAAQTKSLLKRNLFLKPADERAIGVFYGRIFNITQDFNEVISSLDLNFYTRKSHQFDKAFNAYRAGGILLPDKYLRQFKALEATIEPVVTPPTPTGEFIAFHASLERVRSAVRGDVVFDTIDFNIGDALNNLTGVFTAPTNGVYQFMASVLPQSSRSSRVRESVMFDITRDGTTYTRVQSNPIAKNTQVSKTVLIELNKGATVNLRIVLGGARGSGRYTTFGGYLVRAL